MKQQTSIVRFGIFSDRYSYRIPILPKQYRIAQSWVEKEMLEVNWL